MRFSTIGCIKMLAVALIATGCEGDGIGFGNVAPVGNGNGNGGSVEPNLVYQIDSQSSLFDAEISDDASQLVFVGDDDLAGQNPDTQEQIFTVTVSTSNAVQVTTATAANPQPFRDWDITDDGGQVLFASTDDLTGSNTSGSHNLFIASTDGSSISQVTQNTTTGFYNEWEISGAGDVVVFSSEMDLLGANPANQNQLYRINADGSSLVQVTVDAAYETDIALSQDGNWIVYLSGGDPLGLNVDLGLELFVINSDGTNHRQLTNITGTSNLARPEISDDGSRIVFASQQDLTGNNTDTQYEVFTIGGDGSGLTQVSNSARPSGVFTNGTPGDYDISGNGSYVVFGSDFDFTGQNPNSDHTFYWASVDGVMLGQSIHEGTVISGSGFTAQNVSIDGSGDVIAFESTLNMSTGASGFTEKIYSIARQ